MNKSEVENALTTLLGSEQKLGFYTEFFVEAGYLDQPSPLFRAGNDSKFFDLASLTKALVTGPLTYQYLKDRLHTPLKGLWPKSSQAGVSSDLMALTPFELLSHRSGLEAWRNFWVGHLSEAPLPKAHYFNPIIRKTFERVKVGATKGDLYSDLNYILLGFTLEAFGGNSLDLMWSRYLAPLNLSSETFGFSPQLSAQKIDFVPSAFCPVRNRFLQGEAHDENCAALGGVAGHAGLFAQGPKVGEYLRALAHSNEGQVYFEANEKERLAHSFEGLAGLRRGNGQSAQLFAEGQGMGHLGFVGTAFWIHWPSKRYVVFLSNRVISGRVNPRMTEVRREVFGLLNELF